MSGRLRSKADVVMDPRALEAAIASAEDHASRGKDMLLVLSGSFCSDSDGDYLTIDGVADRSDGGVGICVSYEAGGTVPAEESVERFVSTFQTGVMVVIDAYARKFALYVRSGDGVRPASAVLTERSDPYRVAPAHLLLGDAAFLHYLAHKAFEELVRRVLEGGTQRGDLGFLGYVEKQDRVGDGGEVAGAVGGEGYDLGAYAPGDAGGLYDGGRLPGVGEEDQKVLRRQYGRRHLSDEVHVEPELDQADREELPYQPGPSGTVDEDPPAVEYGLEQDVLRGFVHRLDGAPADV